MIVAVLVCVRELERDTEPEDVDDGVPDGERDAVEAMVGVSVLVRVIEVESFCELVFVRVIVAAATARARGASSMSL